MCHEHFSTVDNFDKHHVAAPPRKCKHPGSWTRQKRDGSTVPVLKSVPTVFGPLWVTWTPENEEVPA